MTAAAQPATTQSGDYAGLVTRALAFALDVAIVQVAITVVGAVVALIISAFGDVSIDINLDALGVAAALLTWAFIFDVYLISFWTLTGQTPGMRILGVKVTTTKGTNLKPRRGVVRVVGMVIAAIPLFLGYLPILTSSRRQGLHDRMARSVVRYVVDEPKPERHLGGARR